jgi:hypothetical protein
MDFDIQSKTVIWSYTDMGLPGPSGTNSEPNATVAEFSLPRTFVYRRIWAVAFAVPTGDSYPQYTGRISAFNKSSSAQNVIAWRTRHNQGLSDVAPFLNTAEGHASFAPPFCAIEDVFSPPDLGFSLHAGSDARVLAFQIRPMTDPQAIRSVFRATVYPIHVTSEMESIRFRIENFFGQNSVGSPSGTSFDGYLCAGMIVQSQLRPFS